VKKIIPGVFFLLLPAGLFIFIDLRVQLSSFTITAHNYRLQSLLLAAFVFPAFILLFFLWKKRGNTYRTSENSAHILKHFLPYAPYLLLLFSPLLLTFYIDRGDLRQRLDVLFLLVNLFVLFQVYQQYTVRIQIRQFAEKKLKRFSALPLKKKLVFLFVFAFAVYNLCTFVLISKGVTFSGDEPYYLLTAHSLQQDQDINVWNNYAQKDYFHFYEKDKNPNLELGIYARDGRKGDKYLYPINLSGVSFLMLPHYWLSQHFSGKTRTFILKGSLAIWAVLLGLQIYLFALEHWRKANLSLAIWFLYSFSVPVLFYATHLYPEIPIALFSIYVFRKVRSKKPLSSLNLVFLGFVLSLFLWFGLKYNMIFFPLLLVSLYFLLKEHRARWKILCFLAPPLLSLGLFYLYLYELYGAFSPFSIYEGVMTPEKVQAFKEMIVKIPIMLRIDTFFDYFLDQRDGLLLYSPLYLFGFLGMIEVFRRSKRDLLILLFIAAPFIFNYAFFTHRQGYCPQARILTPISWVAILFVGYFLIYNKKRIFTKIFWILGAASLILTFLLLLHPSFLYQPTTHEFTSRPGDMFISLSNMFVFLPDFLPSFIKINNLHYLPNYVWILAIIFFVSIYTFRKKESSSKPVSRMLVSYGFLFLFIVLWVVFPRAALYPTRVFKYSEQTSLGYYMAPMGKGVVAHRAAELFLHREGDYKILFSSRKKLKDIKVIFGSEKGEYRVKFSIFDLPQFEGKISYEKKELNLYLSNSFHYKWLYLYEIDLNLKHLSSELMVRNPFFFQVIPSH